MQKTDGTTIIQHKPAATLSGENSITSASCIDEITMITKHYYD